jgi:hypothetical protein
VLMLEELEVRREAERVAAPPRRVMYFGRVGKGGQSWFRGDEGVRILGRRVQLGLL